MSIVQEWLNKYKKIPLQVKASAWFLMCSFLQKGISTITTPIFTRLLSSSEYGQYSVFQSWFSVLSTFITLSLYQGIFTQGLVKFEEERDIYSSSLQGLALTLCGVWAAVYCTNISFWNNLFGLNTVQMAALLIMCWTTGVFGFWASEQRVTYKYIRLVIVTIIVAVVKPVLSIILVLCAKDKVTARIIGIVLTEVLVYTWLFLAQMKKGKVFFSKRFWPYALKLAIPLIPHYLAATVLSSSDRIMIKSMVSESAAGIYSLAYSISQIMLLFNASLIQAISPWLLQKIKEKKLKDIGKVAYPAMLIICGVNILLIALAPEIVSFFAPKEYYEAIYVIPPIAMSVFFMFAYDLFASFEFYYEKTKYIAAATAVAAVCNIILNYFFIGRFGYYAAGYTTLACYALYAAFHYFFMRKVCLRNLGEMAYRTKTILAISLVFLLLGSLFLVTYGYPCLRYLLLCLIVVMVVWKRKMILSNVLGLLRLKKQSEKE